MWLQPVTCPSSSSSCFVSGSGRSLSSINYFASKPRKHHLICNASWQELAGVLLFSAIPFTAVKTIANSPLGESLQRKMEETKQLALQNSSKFKTQAAKARKQR